LKNIARTLLRLTLSTLLPVFASSACTANRAVPNGTLFCRATDDCPAGYLCVNTGTRQICCRNGDCNTDAGGGPPPGQADGATDHHDDADSGTAMCDPPPAICQGRSGSLQLGEGAIDEMDVAVSCVDKLCVTGGITP
jgi:hypothetical protein